MVQIPAPPRPSNIDWRAAHWDQWADLMVARGEHQLVVDALTALGVVVEYLDAPTCTPNLHFVQDLFVMTPFGAVVGRPASKVRAGEEVFAAKALAAIEVPIVATVCGTGTFEGADLAYLSPDLAIIAVGRRTNVEGARQVAHALGVAGVRVEQVPMPAARRHLDEVISIVSEDTALVSRDAPAVTRQVLRANGFALVDVPIEAASTDARGINLIVIERGLVLLPAGSPRLTETLAGLGIRSVEVPIPEISNTGGGVHCLLGVLLRSDGA
jgi:N-dimethylarginine dimethylaminohydrolase